MIEFRVGERLYTVYSTRGKFNDKWTVKVETVMPNKLFEERLYQFWTLDAAYHFIKACQDEIL